MNRIFRDAAAIVLLTLAACAGTPPQSPAPADPTEATAEDAAVFRVVVEDLLRWNEFRTYRTWESRSKVVVWDETEGLSFFITFGQLSSELRDRPEVPVELYNGLKARNSRKSAVPELGTSVASRDRRDRFPGREAFSDAFERKHPEARAFVGFWLPAYAEDGASALVRFSFGPTVHGACGTYLLKKQDGVWTAGWRKLSYYA